MTLITPDMPALMLAKTYHPRYNVTGWWASEKLDGVRAYWDGMGGLWSRGENRLWAPAWFIARLPQGIALDGELWGGRGAFQRVSGWVRQAQAGDGWRSIQYAVFDAPRTPGTFEARLDAARAACIEGGVARVVHHWRVASAQALAAELVRVEALGAEGLMLREPGSLYIGGRSSIALKVKSHADAEAKVIAHLNGRGRLSDKCGALRCELADGTQFKIGSGLSDVERESPPAIGAIVTFRYQELTDGGVPRFPRFVAVAHGWRARLGQTSQSIRRVSPLPAVAGNMVAPDREALEPPRPGTPQIGVFELIYERGASPRIWVATWHDGQVEIIYGRRGRTMHGQRKHFANANESMTYLKRLAAQKIVKGYRLTVSTPPSMHSL